MICHISPTKSLQGSFVLPGSKSYSIRSFFVAACGGNSKILNPSDCDDAKVSARVAKALGATVETDKDNVWFVQAHQKSPRLSKVNVKESGTSLRFILPLLPIYSQGKTSSVIGEGTLVGRPNHFLNETLRVSGVEIQGEGKSESVPIDYTGGSIFQKKLTIDGSISSQFISALMIACPHLDHDTVINLVGEKIVSQDYLMMTEQILAKAGIEVIRKGKRKIIIPGNQTFKGLKNFGVPSDYGLAAFHLAAAVLVESDLTLKGHLRNDLIQADGHILPLLDKMGVQMKRTSKSIKIKGPQTLKGGKFSLRDCPDLVPIMSVLCLFADRPSRLVDIAHARVKESDRISDLREELLKVGAQIEEKSDEMIIYPLGDFKPDQLLDPHHDHRLAMAFSVLGLKIGTKIKDFECTHKSYPSFRKDFKSIGARIKTI